MGFMHALQTVTRFPEVCCFDTNILQEVQWFAYLCSSGSLQRSLQFNYRVSPSLPRWIQSLESILSLFPCLFTNGCKMNVHQKLPNKFFFSSSALSSNRILCRVFESNFMSILLLLPPLGNWDGLLCSVIEEIDHKIFNGLSFGDCKHGAIWQSCAIYFYFLRCCYTRHLNFFVSSAEILSRDGIPRKRYSCEIVTARLAI